MSNLAYQGDDHPEAAAKHLDDVEVLFLARRHDGAAYLAGYVLECSFKTVVILEEVARSAGLSPATLASALPSGGKLFTKGKSALKHDLERLSKEALRLASLPSAATASYIPATSAQALYAGAWTESLRYQKRGVIGAMMAGQWLGEARSVFQSTIARMRRDGVVVF
jgi:hypothetical protein